MKIIVRSFVIALAVTGAIATSYAKPTSATKVTVAKTSAAPTPTCPPSSPNGCGFGTW
jgi:hypothetical protein